VFVDTIKNELQICRALYKRRRSSKLREIWIWKAV